MKVTNNNGRTFDFNAEDMQTIFMYAYGYMDLSEKGVLNIDLDTKDHKVYDTHEKLKQCFKDEYTVHEKIKRHLK